MPPIRRTVAFAILILLLLPVLFLASRDAFQSSPVSQDTSLSCTRTAQSLSPLDLSTSTQVETSIPGSELITGFTLLDRLYLRNGTFFIVAANLSAFPSRWNMIAPGVDLSSGNTEPTDKVQIYNDCFPCQTYNQCHLKELRFLDSTGEVDKVLGRNAVRIEGLSIIVYDTKQFMPVRHFEKDLAIY
jgi:protein O-GlcNAc transferase